MSFETCPRCGRPESMHLDYYYKTGEEYAMCITCGYYHEHSIKRDDKGSIIFSNKKKPRDIENVKWINKQSRNPFGIIHVHGRSVGQLFVLPAKKDLDDFLLDIKEHGALDEVECITLSRVSKSKHIETTLYRKNQFLLTSRENG